MTPRRAATTAARGWARRVHDGRPHGGGGASGGSTRTEQAQRPLAHLKGHCEQRADQPTLTGPPPAPATPGRAATTAARGWAASRRRRRFRRLGADRASSAAARGPEGALRAASSPTHLDRAPTSQPATPAKEGQHADRPGRHGGGGAFGGSARTEGAQRPLAKQKGHDQRRDQPTSTGPPPASQTHTRMSTDGRPHARTELSAASHGPEARCKERRDRGTCRHQHQTGHEQ